ncbi:stage III sporulation protein AE [Heyndrickxia oleronia]|uniref:Stage III sporulation protein AE n=2 Tax=Heyndrickxia TaxID=2837504 RepID=A0A8E2IF07_9BACI|nr:stage III sporulation protein AE [Heyndrickxia oleronia]NYV65949.1 stage III sporulation protein AE [Bacillus sp. Gen3]OJH18818.1 stage III sporulation protein AE [Bacillus obstructivus]MBU5214302.1 stage III sporulation protein AE [Heyndrickxia oleronia]MEC1374372.1 stage III sporulation protein AE [Heyndrickxia oleronia]OOP69875.1 stage III sporulation protein AE [Heyndrickxia oleronia]
MRQWILIIMAILFTTLFGQSNIYAASNSETNPSLQEELVEKQMNDLGIDELKQYWDNVIQEYGGYLPDSQKGSLIDFIKGDKEFSLNQWFKGILKFTFHELIANGKLLGSLIILTIFSMFLQSLHQAFEQGTISKVAYAIVFIVLTILALNSFHVAIEYAKNAISMMTNFILAIIPLLLALISTSGGITSAAFFHPVILFLMNTSGVLVQYIVLPLLLLSTILSIVSTLSDQYKATQLAQLLRNGSIGLLGIFMTIFLGVISVQGTATAVTDGITIRTAKFVTGNFVPVIGRMFTDAADTVISASVLLKNTLGIAGVAIVLIIAAFPAIKILALAFMFKFTAAIIQPIGNGPVIKCLDTISKNMVYVFAALAIVALMFFLSITIIIVAGNITMMMR